jgi:hypothetical protein
VKINKKYLPSKKFITALSIAVFVILVAIALTYIKPGGTNNNNNLSVLSATTTPSEIDSDHDGLPDWEEALYGTDPHNPDTDGDGTPDGEEIKEGRDPLKANTAPKGQEPNDKISPALIAESDAIANADQNLNATEKMAHDLISSIIASQPVNGTMDQDTQDTLVQQAIQDIPQKQFTGTTTIADLHIINITGDQFKVEDVLAYAKNYYAQINILRGTMGQDLILINTSMTNGTDLDMNQMGKIISTYQKIINNLIKMPLPMPSNSLAVIYHLRIINDTEGLVNIDNDIINAFSNKDGATVYADLIAYNNTSNDLDTALGVVDYIFHEQQ